VVFNSAFVTPVTAKVLAVALPKEALPETLSEPPSMRPETVKAVAEALAKVAWPVTPNAENVAFAAFRFATYIVLPVALVKVAVESVDNPVTLSVDWREAAPVSQAVEKVALLANSVLELANPVTEIAVPEALVKLSFGKVAVLANSVLELANPVTEMELPEAVLNTSLLVLAVPLNEALETEARPRVVKPVTLSVDWREAPFWTTRLFVVALPEVVSVPKEPKPVVWIVPLPAFKEPTWAAPDTLIVELVTLFVTVRPEKVGVPEVVRFCVRPSVINPEEVAMVRPFVPTL
jgi:hypothetical protein